VWHALHAGSPCKQLFIVPGPNPFPSAAGLQRADIKRACRASQPNRPCVVLRSRDSSRPFSFSSPLRPRLGVGSPSPDPTSSPVSPPTFPSATFPRPVRALLAGGGGSGSPVNYSRRISARGGSGSSAQPPVPASPQRARGSPLPSHGELNGVPSVQSSLPPGIVFGVPDLRGVLAWRAGVLACRRRDRSPSHWAIRDNFFLLCLLACFSRCNGDLQCWGF
jgi:hypothetical protein